MADASAASCVALVVSVKKTPDNLYEVCLTNLVNYLQKCKCERNDLRSLPDSILMDVYYKVSAMCPSYQQKLNKNAPLVG